MKRYKVIVTHASQNDGPLDFPAVFTEQTFIDAKDVWMAVNTVNKLRKDWVSPNGFKINEIALCNENSQIALYNWTLGTIKTNKVPIVKIPLGNT